jgi:hypothetical protein
MNSIVVATEQQSPFDSIRRFDSDGTEYWLARELMSVMGYQKWQRFESPIGQAKENLELNGDNVSDHFLPTTTINGGRPRQDYRLSRVAVNLIYKHADTRKLYPKSSSRQEKTMQMALAEKLKGSQVEVETLAGRIDILTPKQVIEVKRVKDWKSALGQVLVYGHYYPSHQKRIHLYGETQESFLSMVRSHCEKLNVIVTWGV